MSKIYIAVHKETKQLLEGARGQAAYKRRESIGRSMGQSGHKKGTYDIIEVDAAKLIEKAFNTQEFKIEVIHSTNWNDEAFVEMNMPKGCEDISIGSLSEYPEDASLGRDLSFVYSIPTMMKRAYEAGVRGDVFVETHRDEEEDEE
ncbi:hypothetical protein [Bacillus cereus]|uniref:Phage protein n=1 Tax=Bacillus cereus TIAC219 TaxID=718222 RepID=A0ABC9SQR3_BACCE|nr:hypothetical protein [Bacillus cereus]EJP81133.1 hypothetical protein IC1_06621 [Bacillus cereus VD022]EOQ57838.1 hypothetical protein IAY_06248 [Bacillus cereus TIAC219]